MNRDIYDKKKNLTANVYVSILSRNLPKEIPGSWNSQNFLDIRHMKLVRLPGLRTGRVYGSKDSKYLFPSEAESNSRPKCDRKDYVNEKSQWSHWESKPRPFCLWRSASTNCATLCLCFAGFLLGDRKESILIALAQGRDVYKDM